MGGTYTLNDVARHNKPTDAWIIVHNKVYNVTNYLEDHPGGSALLLEVAGKDATTEFEDIGHSVEANDDLAKLYVGDLPEEEHAEEVEVYRPTFQEVAQKARIDPTSNKSSNTSRLLRSILQLGLTGGAAAAAWSIGTGRTHVDWNTVRQGLAHFSAPNSSASGAKFWVGLGVGTAVQMSASFGLFVWAWSKLDVHQDFSHHVSHRLARADRSLPLRYKKSVAAANTEAKPVAARAIGPQEWKPFKLIRKILVSPNVYRLVFALPHPEAVLGLPTGQHIALRATINGQVISRSYTPISNNSDLGRIELLIKVYEKGLMTKHLEAMTIGQTIDIRGPKGAMRYSTKYAKEIGMIAGGTGITPMYQLIRAICADDNDKTRVNLIYANNTEEDILLRDELDSFARQCPDKFKVHYVLAKPPAGWMGSSGFVTADLIREHLPAASDVSRVLLCGPPPMINAMKTNLAALGFQAPGAVSKVQDQIFLF